jgi:cobalt-zinc-cadmium efflux system outer membrane protein
MQSTLGPIPGAGAVPFANPPGAGSDVLGGRLGTSFPRVPASVTTPSAGMAAPIGAPAIAPPPTLRPVERPTYGRLERPMGPEAEGPAGGLTLDAAIEQLVRNNLDIRSKFYEIPQAQADILTASLRANPIFYADSQLIPYGSFSPNRPGGPTQYDINITHPIDINHKRQARIRVAVRAKRVLEAQYQDYVRLQIANLYTAFVDSLYAREIVRFDQVYLAGLTELVGVYQKQFRLNKATKADVDRAETLRQAAQITLWDDQQKYLKTKRTLGTLLSMPPVAGDALEPRGTLADLADPAPGLQDLINTALNCRPDLAAYRMGLQRAMADVKLARANRFSDIYLLYQPFTFQNNTPFEKLSATSWAVGLTVPLPVHNRNQGMIERARLNVSQTQVELLGLERQVVGDVMAAEQEYRATRFFSEQFSEGPMKRARDMRDATRVLFTRGELPDVVPYLTAERDYNDLVRQYTELVVRHRRSMLMLNTAVGQRILP